MLRALEKEPARRFADADEFIAALAGRGVAPARPPATAVIAGAGTGSPVRRSARRRAVVPLGPISESYAYPPQPLGARAGARRAAAGGSRCWSACSSSPRSSAALLLFARQAGDGARRGRRAAGRGRGRRCATAASTPTRSRRRRPTRPGTRHRAEPAPGDSKVDEGATITLTVSERARAGDGPRPGRAWAARAARKKLDGARASGRGATSRPSDEVAQNRVIETLARRRAAARRGHDGDARRLDRARARRRCPTSLGQSREDAERRAARRRLRGRRSTERGARRRRAGHGRHAGPRGGHAAAQGLRR